MKAIIALCIFAGVALAAPIPWKDCGTSADIVDIYAAETSVWPPQRGKDLSIFVYAQVKEDIPDAKYEFSLNIGKFIAFKHKGKLSNFGKFWKPVSSGPWILNETISVPRLLPCKFTASLHLKLTTLDNRGIFCGDLDVTIDNGKKGLEAPYFEALPTPNKEDIITAPIPYTSCDKDSILSIYAAETSVWPPVRGKDLSIFVYAHASERVEDALYETKFAINGIELPAFKGKLSDFPGWEPLEEGPHILNKTVTIPSIIPCGTKLSGHVKLTTLAGKSVGCFDLTVPFEKGLACGADVEVVGVEYAETQPSIILDIRKAVPALSE